MKIADYISKSIQEYPSLYKDVDYEKSKLKVLCHIFFANGTGLEMAETENQNEGGYVVKPKYKKDKKTDDWIRIKDKPYGIEKYKPIPEGYFESIAYYVYASEHPFSPYPIRKGYSIACSVFYDGTFLQVDWMQELILLCKRTLEYFNDKTQYKNNCYYPTENKIKQDLRYFDEQFKKDGLKGLNDLQKTWGYEVKETLPHYEEIENRKTNSWVTFREKQIDFLTTFLNSKNN